MSDAQIGIVIGVIVQLLVVAFGYGILSERVKGLSNRFDSFDTKMFGEDGEGGAIGKLHTICDSTVKELSRVTGCLHAAGLGCGEEEEDGKLDKEGHQETRSTTQSTGSS